jgi:hypothetical protein
MNELAFVKLKIQLSAAVCLAHMRLWAQSPAPKKLFKNQVTYSYNWKIQSILRHYDQKKRRRKEGEITYYCFRLPQYFSLSTLVLILLDYFL